MQQPGRYQILKDTQSAIQSQKEEEKALKQAKAELPGKQYDAALAHEAAMLENLRSKQDDPRYSGKYRGDAKDENKRADMAFGEKMEAERRALDEKLKEKPRTLTFAEDRDQPPRSYNDLKRDHEKMMQGPGSGPGIGRTLTFPEDRGQDLDRGR